MFSDKDGWPEVGDIVEYRSGNDYSKVLILEGLGLKEHCMAYKAWYFDGFYGKGSRVKNFYVWPHDPAWTILARVT